VSSTAIAVVIAAVLAVLLIAAVVAGLRAGGATRSASQRAADAGERLAASRRRLTELEAELFEARRPRPGSRVAASSLPDEPDHSATVSAGAPDSREAAGGPGDAGPSVPSDAPGPSGSSASAALTTGAEVPVATVEAPADASFARDGAIAPDPSETPTPESDQNGHVIDAVWSLERLELDRQRQLEAGIVAMADDIDAGTLVVALQREVERIREEMGTPGELRSDLDADPDGPVGLLVLGAVRLTLGALARRCQAYDLRLEAADGRVAATIVCEGFEPESADETSAAVAAIAAAIADAGATAAFSAGVDGAAHAELSFPVA
jgi:hypothetical protein